MLELLVDVKMFEFTKFYVLFIDAEQILIHVK